MSVRIPPSGTGDATPDVRTREADGTVSGDEQQVVEHGIPDTISDPNRVATSAASATIIGATPKRGRLTITNEADAWLYLRFGSTAASATNYHRRVPPQAEIVFAGDQLVTSEVRGVLSTGAGVANVAEEVYS